MKLRTSIVCYALAALLALPAAVLAAMSLTVEGSNGGNAYTEAASGTGSKGGTWEWDGPDGDLRLNDYDGGYISAGDGGYISAGGGDLNVVISGTNTIDQPDVYGSSGALSNFSGGITITGEEGATLSVSNGSETYSPSWGAIRTGGTNDGGCDLVIDGVDVTAVSHDYRDSGTYGGVEIGGDIVITNGGSLTSSIVHGEEGEVHDHAYNAGVYAWGGVIVEKGSSLTASSDQGVGVLATSLAVTDSTLDASGPIAAVAMSNGDPTSILIDGQSYISSPAEAVPTVIDTGYSRAYMWGTNWTFLTVEGEDGEAVPVTELAVRIREPEPEPEPEPESVPVPEPEPEPEPAPAPAPTVLPKTADATLLVEAALSASGALLALASGIRRRRMN